MDEISIRLHEQYLAGDAEAAKQIFERYLGRLVALARARMSERLSQRVDAEDVVQSVFRSFFIKARDGRFDIDKAGDLWRLLASITVNKVLKKAEHHRQKKRALNREQPMASNEDDSVFAARFAGREPTPDDALALIEEVEAVTSRLTAVERDILELRLQGHETPEIAAAVDRSKRTVRRTIEKVRGELEYRLLGGSLPAIAEMSALPRPITSENVKQSD